MHKSELSSPTLIGFIWANRRRFMPGLALAISRVIIISPFPIIFRSILDKQMPHRNVAGIVWMALLMMCLLVLHQIISVAGASRLGATVTRTILQVRALIFNKIQYLSFSYLDRQKTGRLLAKYAFDTQKLDNVAMPMLNGFVPNTVYSIITLSILLVMNWQLSLILVFMLPIMAFMRGYYFARLRKGHQANRIAQEKMTGTATEYFGALRLVRSYGEEERAKSQLHETNKEVARSYINLIHLSSSFGAFSFGAVQFLSLIAVAGGAVLSIYGQVSAGTVLAFVAGLGPLVQPIQMFSNLSDQYFLGQEAYNSIRELLGEEDMEQWHGTRTLTRISGRVEFNHVSFMYPGAERPALEDFTLTMEPGERVALVGQSGAGKSTVASLLLGLYAAETGEVRIDGVPQADLDMRWLRRNTAVVMQDSILLSGTVADNIRFARDDASDAEVHEAARLAHAEEFILQMPEGYDTVIGERGVMLSGGQRQRISIARALLRDPAILILDEPTSALDYESERLIQEAIDILARGRTVITIAHRLSTIRNADRVVVLHNGKMVETGTFEALSEHGGYFHRMLEAQSVVLAQ